MTQKISAEEVYQSLEERLELRWVAGRAGGTRTLSALGSQSLRPSLAGFLNLIHPNNIQILGREEVSYLDTLEARQRWETLSGILSREPTALVVSDGVRVPDDLSDAAEDAGTALWASPVEGVELVSRLQHLLARRVARRTTVHGVFMEVFSIGVLLSGESGAGKSELALELITRGHRLVADDAPEMTVVAPDILDGTCPPLLKDCLEVRGLGILNIRAMFGDSAIKANKYLRLIVHLKLMDAEAIAETDMDRLRGDVSHEEILGVEIPRFTVPVAPGRNLAVLVEAAVRNHNLKMAGFDAAEDFLARHASALKSAASEE